MLLAAKAKIGVIENSVTAWMMADSVSPAVSSKESNSRNKNFPTMNG